MFCLAFLVAVSGAEDHMFTYFVHVLGLHLTAFDPQNNTVQSPMLFNRLWNNWSVLDLSLLWKVLHGTRGEQTLPPARKTLGNQGNHRPVFLAVHGRSVVYSCFYNRKTNQDWNHPFCLFSWLFCLLIWRHGCFYLTMLPRSESS